MGSELIGFLSFSLSLNPGHMLFSFWRSCLFLYLSLFDLLVSILGHTSTKIIINKGCSLLFLSRDLNVSVYSEPGVSPEALRFPMTNVIDQDVSGFCKN